MVKIKIFRWCERATVATMDSHKSDKKESKEQNMDVEPQSAGGKNADADDDGNEDEAKEEDQVSGDQEEEDSNKEEEDNEEEEEEEEDNEEEEEEEDNEEEEEEHFTKLVKYKSRNTDEAALIKALGKFDSRPMSFCVHGLLTEIPSPGLCLGNNFEFFTPVKAEVLPQIVASNVMEDAPFGKGKNTVLDPKVRSTLQASPNKCTFLNPAWDPFVQSIAERCAKEMGVLYRVRASLHKLLVYRPRDHFDQHRDAVHEPRMFGTLIVQLPCTYTGGKLAVEHAGAKVEIDDAAVAGFQLSYAAFFADCQHTVYAVESGLRVVLVYNNQTSQAALEHASNPRP